MRGLAVASLLLSLLVACHSNGSMVTNEATEPSTTQYTGPLPLDTGPAPWPLPDYEIERTIAAGVPTYRSESLFYHVHAHLDVFVDGARVVIPAGLGISESLARSTCATACIAALHTHAEDGVLHTESDRKRVNVLGEVFGEWGVRFDGTCIGGYCPPEPIAVYVNGTRVTTDPRQIALTDREEIAIVIGRPPTTVPSHV